MKDLFISHASEDKEELVRPLVEELKKYGVDIWYDEFELKIGDSLSASIDYGLSNSSYGLLILSPSFLAKKWTDYELKSLLVKEIHKGKTILPIWHNITLEQVMERSLYLADKKAVTSDIGVKKLAIEIVKNVRPDILSFWASRAAYQKAREKAPIVEIAFSDITENDKIHTSFPFHMYVASALFQSVFPEICKFADMMDGFSRDVDYDTEFGMWVIISCTYIDAMRELNLILSSEKGKDIFAYVLNLSVGGMEYNKYIGLEEKEEQVVLQAYYRNASFIMPLLKGERFEEKIQCQES